MSTNKTYTSMEGNRETSSNDSDLKVNNIVEHSMDGISAQEPFKTNIKEQPVTLERKPFAPQKGDRLTNAGTPRATIAASEERPNGTTEGNYAKDHQHQTVLDFLLTQRGTRC